MKKIIKLKIFNSSCGILNLTGYLKLNEIDLVDCDATTIEKEIEVNNEEGVLVWKRAKIDQLEEGIFILKFKDNNELVIKNSPSFDGVKVILNGVNIIGKFKYKG